jgi:hypothetical protein
MIDRRNRLGVVEEIALDLIVEEVGEDETVFIGWLKA